MLILQIHTNAEWYFVQPYSVFLNVKVCCWVIRLIFDLPALQSIHPTLPRTHPIHCLSRAGLSPLHSPAPGPLLKCIIVWAELVGSSESPTESHTEFVFLYESHSDCFCFISLTNCSGAGTLKMGVNQLIMSAVLYFQLCKTWKQLARKYLKVYI